MSPDNLRSLSAKQLGVLYNEVTRIGYSESGVTEQDRYLTNVESEVLLRLARVGQTLKVLIGLVDGTETVDDRKRLGIGILEMLVRERRDLWSEFDSRCRLDTRWHEAFEAAWVPKVIAQDMPLGLRATVIHID